MSGPTGAAGAESAQAGPGTDPGAMAQAGVFVDRNTPMPGQPGGPGYAEALGYGDGRVGDSAASSFFAAEGAADKGTGSGSFAFQGIFSDSQASEAEAGARAPARISAAPGAGVNPGASSASPIVSSGGAVRERYALSSQARAATSADAVSCLDLREGSAIQVLREINGWAEILPPSGAAIATDASCRATQTYYVPLESLIQLPPVMRSHSEATSTVVSPYVQGIPVHLLPSEFSNHCGYLPNHAELRVVQRVGAWTEILLLDQSDTRVADCRGSGRLFVQSDFVALSKPADTSGLYRHYVGTQLRTAPRRGAPSCASLEHAGEVLRVLEHQGEWTRVALPTDAEPKLKDCMRAGKLYVESRFLIEVPDPVETADKSAKKMVVGSAKGETDPAFVVQLPSQYGGDCGDVADGTLVEVLQQFGEWSEIALPMDLVLAKCVDPARLFILTENLTN